MNGFSIMADSYRQLMDKGEISAEAAERAIAVYEFLGTCDKRDLCRIVDSSALNSIIRAFVTKATEGAGLDKVSAKRVLREFDSLLDDAAAEEVIRLKASDPGSQV